MARSGTPRRWARRSAISAGRLLDRLRDRFAPGGLLHYGQGKWYPGEPLPRWALTCYWRDRRRAAVARSRTAGPRGRRSTSFGAAGSRSASRKRWRAAWASIPDYVNPAFEDPFYYLQRERQLPVNVDPVDNRLEDPHGARAAPPRLRARPRNASGHGAAAAARLRARTARNGKPDCGCCAGSTCFWFPAILRWACGCRCRVCPGWRPDDAPQVHPRRSDGESRPPAGSPRAMSPIVEPSMQVRNRESRPSATECPRLGESAPWIVRTALCVEPRDGRLHVFMPPLARMPKITSICWPRIEDTAAHLEDAGGDRRLSAASRSRASSTSR